MTSSMLAGERRWASARRGGMTVLGKVPVPKPVNLPSQRLENHGLDPNVEIVPKGTLSWGSRASSSASNAWGSSTLSPNADGGTSSPSHLSGRPSSGSGTRPSTAGSDRTHEPTPNAWGQSSRPSSASGALTSNQTALTTLRPRSADTRPGSSQLSRFAEPSADNSVAWGPTGVSEKLGVASSKNDGFSLSSGDFPTLGSERDNSGKSTPSQDDASYGRLGSSSDRAASGKEKSVTSSAGEISVNANVKSGAVNTWRRDGTQHVEDGGHPTVEKWQEDRQPYLNPNVPPQHFDAWHGPPINHPPGVWFRGPPGGPPYGTPLPPGGFPIEPFPYYRPQIPPTALANSQPVPPPGSGPRGHHPKTGDMYRPHIPDAYIRPGMPFRPGFYPGPMVYEGYYGPPMGYCNSNERDIPFMGMAAGPPGYNRYSGENVPDPGNSHARAGPHHSTGKTLVSEQVECGRPDDTRGPYKVLLKQHNEWSEKREEDKWEHALPANALEKGDQPRTSLQKNEWGLEETKDEEMYSGRRTLGGDASSQNFDNQGSFSSDSVTVKLPESRGKAKAVDDSLVHKLEITASTFPQVPQVFPATPKDPTLIQKIEGLNAKARASDGRPDAVSISSREEQKSRSQLVDAKANRVTNEAGTDAVRFEKTHAGGYLIPVSHEVDNTTTDKTLWPAASSGTAISRRASHGVQGRLDHRGKSFNTQDADGWRKKPLAAESTTAVSAVNSEPSPNVHVQDHLPSAEAAEKSGINLQGKDEGESLTPTFDPSDCQAQRTKMREIAKQRAKQLQKEEEERIREQKAKALAKLEELNRRTQAMDGYTQKLEEALPGVPIQQEREESRPAESVMVARKSDTPSSALVSIPRTQIRESSILGVGESTVLSKDTLLEKSDYVQPEPVVPHVQPLALQQDAHTAGAADCIAAPQVNEGSVSRHKPMGYKQKQNNSLGKNLTEKSVPISPTEAPKEHADVAVNDVASTDVVAGEVGTSCESSLPMNSNIMAESSAHQRRKSNRSSKNKHKLDDVSSIAALPSTVPKETNTEKFSTGSGQPKASELELDHSSIQSRTDAKHVIQSSEQHPSLPSQEASGRVTNQWKSQHSRWMPRNQQANRMAEKLHSSDAAIWAPVRSPNKPEVMDGISNETVPETVTATAKSNNVVQNNLKSKRAEMERYIPKPVAKEQAQQGSIQQPVLPLVNQTSLDDTVGRAEPSQNIESSQPDNSAIGNIGSTAVSRNGNGKQNKQSKAQGSWRQRGPMESAFVQGLQDGSSSTSNASKNVQKSIEHHQFLKPDVSSLKEQTKSFDGWNTSDGWNTPDSSDTAAPITSAVVKDQGVTGRGKRHPFKGQRSMGNNNDHDRRNVHSGDTDKSSSPTPTPEIGQTDKSIALKENRGVGERTSSHWQPKSQVYSVHNQRGNRPSGGQNIAADVSNAMKKDSPSQDRVHLPPHHNKESGEHMVQPPTGPSLSEQKNVAEAPNLGHQESKRERKVTSFRGRPHSPSKSSVNMAEQVPLASIDTQNDQPISSGFQKNGNQNNRSGRGHESRGDWISAGQDIRQHNSSSNRERQRHNSHYEYQPIGQSNSNKFNNFEGPTDGSHNTGSRYRERGQGHSRRGGGNFYGRQSGTVHVDASYD